MTTTVQGLVLRQTLGFKREKRKKRDKKEIEKR